MDRAKTRPALPSEGSDRPRRRVSALNVDFIAHSLSVELGSQLMRRHAPTLGKERAEGWRSAASNSTMSFPTRYGRARLVTESEPTCDASQAWHSRDE